MILQTERLILKPLGIEYLQTVNKYATDIENTRYMVHLPNENIEETKRFLTEVDEEWKKKSHHFIAHCDSENMASRKVMEKLGMKLVEQYSGRKNRASDEEREECMYCLDVKIHKLFTK